MADPAHTNHSDGPITASETDRTTRRDWEWLPKHPDLQRDFGYVLANLDTIPIEDTGEVLVLPREDRAGESNRFIVIDRHDLVSLEEG